MMLRKLLALALTKTVERVLNDASSPDYSPMQERATQFVRDALQHYRAYHNHKETLAIAGITFHVTAFGVALISKDWPPYRPLLTSVLITLAWLLILFYLKWQLHRRRWAAMRMAGAERLLARWISQPPSPDELKPAPVEKKKQPSICTILIDYVVAVKGVEPTVDISEPVYPTALVRLWQEQEERERPTRAIVQERFIVLVGWILWLALLVRTWRVDLKELLGMLIH